MKRTASIAVFVPLALALVAADRLSKAWAAANLYAGVAELDLGPVNLTLVYNTGAAFGIGEGSTYVFIAIAACIVTLIVAWLAGVKWHSKLEVFSLALVAAGGVGNLIDRVQWGYVVDFIEFTFIDFPVFNVADVCVTCGVALFIIAVLFCMDLSFEDPDGDDDGGPRQAGAVEAAADAVDPQVAVSGAGDAPAPATPWAPLGAEEPDAPMAAGPATADAPAVAAAGEEPASAPAPELSPLDVEGVLAAHGKTASARVERAAVEARYYDSPASYGPRAASAAASRPAAAVSAGRRVVPAGCEPVAAPEAARDAGSDPAVADPGPAPDAEVPRQRHSSVAAELLAELRAGSQGGTRA